MEEHVGGWLLPLIEREPEWLRPWVDLFTGHALLMVLLLGLFAFLATRRLQLIPTGKLQVFGEWVYEGLLGLARSTLGAHHGREYAWIIGSFFLYIFCMNLLGLVPGFLSPTARVNTTAALGLAAITIAQVIGVRHNGLRYFTRFWICVPIKGWRVPVFPNPFKHIEELIKPVSLAMRLFGNIFGDDTAIVQFAMLGAGALALVVDPAEAVGPLLRVGGLLGTVLGVGITSVMLVFALLVAFIQAFVFSLLTGAYVTFAIEME